MHHKKKKKKHGFGAKKASPPWSMKDTDTGPAPKSEVGFPALKMKAKKDARKA